MHSKLKKSKITIRLLCLLIAAMMLVSILAACKGETESTTASTSGTTSKGDTTTSGEISITNPYDKPKGEEIIPEAYLEDFGGADFRILSRGSGGWTGDDISGSATGTSVDTAVYNRNQKITSQYNFNIKETKDKSWLVSAEKLGAAQEDTYDMWCFKMNDMPSLAQVGYVKDLYKVPSINYNAWYYDQNLRVQGTFANKLFFLTGDLLYMDDMSTSVTYFNATLWENAQLSDKYGKDVYELVDDGMWTLERIKTLASLVMEDLDGNGVMNDKDIWGYNYQSADILGLNIAANNNLLQKNNDDVFVLNQSEKQINDMISIIEFLNSGYSYSNNWETSLFTVGQQLFSFGFINATADYSAKGLNYGVAPPPKMEDDQAIYRSFITTYGSNCITICATVKNVDMIASMIELLSYESMNTVTPKLYEYLLDGRVIDNLRDRDMLGIALESRGYELCYLWSTGAVYSTMTSLTTAKSIAVTSALATCDEAVQESVRRKLERIQLLND